MKGLKTCSASTTATTSADTTGVSAVDELPAHHVVSYSAFGKRRLHFDNPWDTWKRNSALGALRWKWQTRSASQDLGGGWLTWSHRPSKAEISAALPVHPLDTAALAAPPAEAVQATWVGHSTVLVQLEGCTFLTDPIFSERCSPSQRLGPRRLVPPALDAHAPELASLDFVVISHAHYDHLDANSVKMLHERFGDDIAWYVPLGLGRWLRRRGIRRVVELDWWQAVEHPLGERRGGGGADGSGAAGNAGADAEGGRFGAGPQALGAQPTSVRVVLTPAQHWSARSIADRNESLWGGWAVLGRHNRFWFAGDTGYCPAFVEIGERLGPFDLAAIPIGAYDPAWFLSPQHIGPEEAVTIHRDVRAHASIAIHHATFVLSDEAVDEPAARLAHAAGAAGLAPGEFVAIRHGATLAAARETERASPLPSPVVPAHVERAKAAAA